MEEMIRKAFANYARYVAEAELYERWLSTRDDADVQRKLENVQLRLTIIQSWLSLLNADERFVVQKHLIEEIEWPRIAFSFSEMWKGEFTRTERTLLHYQASALRKIADFCTCHYEMAALVFSDVV